MIIDVSSLTYIADVGNMRPTSLRGSGKDDHSQGRRRPAARGEDGKMEEVAATYKLKLYAYD